MQVERRGSRERSCLAPQRAPLRSDQLRQVQLQRRGDRLQEERLSTTHLQRQGPGQRGMLSKVCSHGGRDEESSALKTTSKSAEASTVETVTSATEGRATRCPQR